MNDQNPTPPGPIPPPIPPTAAAANPAVPPVMQSWQPPGSHPTERVPIAGVFSAVEAILRQPRRMMFHIMQPNSGGLIGALLGIAIVCALVYGLVVGTFSGSEQLWAAPVKIVCGLIISALICLPSLYIFSCLGGSQARLVEVFAMIAGLLALMTVLLIGFAPVAWVFSQSTKSEAMMGGLHLAFWLVATLFGLRFLLSGFSHFSTRNYSGLYVWTVVFLLVALQMTTALRPIIGRSNTLLPAATEKKFFLQHWADCMNSEAQVTAQKRD